MSIGLSDRIAIVPACKAARFTRVAFAGISERTEDLFSLLWNRSPPSRKLTRTVAMSSVGEVPQWFHWHTRLPRSGHDLCTFQRQTSIAQTLAPGCRCQAVKIRAFTILGEFQQGQTELVGKAVILADGKAWRGDCRYRPSAWPTRSGEIEKFRSVT
jgi:hypothetical protein